MAVVAYTMVLIGLEEAVKLVVKLASIVLCVGRVFVIDRVVDFVSPQAKHRKEAMKQNNNQAVC